MASVDDILSELGLGKYQSVFQDEYITTADSFEHLTESDLARLVPPLGPRRKLGHKIDVMLGRDADPEKEAVCLAGHWWFAPFARLQSDDPIKPTQTEGDMITTDGGLRLQKGWVLGPDDEATNGVGGGGGGGDWGASASGGAEFALKMKGLPFRARFDEIAAFFQWAEVAIIPRSAFLEVAEDGRKSGNAFVKFAAEADRDKAVSMLFGERFSDSCDRNINLYKATVEEYKESRNAVPKMPNGDSHCISRLMKHRQDSRRAKDYETADALREKVDSMGVIVNEDLRTWTRGGESGAWGPQTPSGGAEDHELEALGEAPEAPAAEAPAETGGQEDWGAPAAAPAAEAAPAEQW